MSFLVTTSAERDEVPVGIGSHPTPRLHVMNLEILRRPAVLASPAVPLEDLLSKFLVSFPIQSKAGPFLTQGSHEAFCSPSRKLTFIGPGSMSNIRFIESSTASRLLSSLAPARKSAQIISKQ